MKLKSIAAAAMAVALSSPVMAATCTETFNLGTMGPPDIATIGNSFSRTGQYNDCYNFTLSGPAQAAGVTLEWDLSFLRNIAVTGVSLTGAGLSQAATDTTPGYFTFGGLIGGAYQLVVSSSVTGYNLGSSPVGYFGALATAPVPEADTLAMLALGLGAVGWAARRRRQG